MFLCQFVVFQKPQHITVCRRYENQCNLPLFHQQTPIILEDRIDLRNGAGSAQLRTVDSDIADESDAVTANSESLAKSVPI